MNKSETAKLLGMAQSVDSRNVSELDVEVWQRFLAPYTFADCERALFEHYQNGRDFLMPSDIIRRVKAVRADRLRRLGTLVPPAELEDAEAQRWLQDATRRAADGLAERKAIGGRA